MKKKTFIKRITAKYRKLDARKRKFKKECLLFLSRLLVATDEDSTLPCDIYIDTGPSSYKPHITDLYIDSYNGYIHAKCDDCDEFVDEYDDNFLYQIIRYFENETH